MLSRSNFLPREPEMKKVSRNMIFIERSKDAFVKFSGLSLVFCVLGAGLAFANNPKGQFLSVDFPLSQDTAPNGVNSSGVIAGRYDDKKGNLHGFVRDPNGEFTSFDVPNSVGTMPISIDSSGVIVGNYYEKGTHGFIRNPDGKIATFDAPKSDDTNVFAISPQGTIVVGRYSYIGVDSNRYNSCFERKANGEIVSYIVEGKICTPTSVNSAGTTIGNYYRESAQTYGGFVRDAAGKITKLDIVPSFLNEEGVIAGCSQKVRAGPVECFMRDASGKSTSLDFPQNWSVSITDISPEGIIKGVYTLNDNTVNYVRTFVLDARGGLTTSTLLVVPGGSDVFPLKIYQNGDIIGGYSRPVGSRHGFIFKPYPVK
jgi:hypothetical protein